MPSLLPASVRLFSLSGHQMTKTAFAAAFGAYHLAGMEANGLADPAEDAARRYDEALENVTAIQAPNPAGVLIKIEIVAEHVRDQAEQFGRLGSELDACERELSAANADLAHVGDALAVVSRRLEREGLHESFVRLLRSAGRDARALSGRNGSHCQAL